eukprot:189741-Karenia_brevis.AAC.2
MGSGGMGPQGSGGMGPQGSGGMGPCGKGSLPALTMFGESGVADMDGSGGTERDKGPQLMAIDDEERAQFSEEICNINKQIKDAENNQKALKFKPDRSSADDQETLICIQSRTSEFGNLCTHRSF